MAHVATMKYHDPPLYRQERQFERQGFKLHRSTTCDWMAEVAKLLTPLYQLMVVSVLQSRVIWTDETRLPMLDKNRDSTRPARIWLYAGDREHPYHVFDFTESRSRDGPQKFLADYRGYLQADAFSGYDGIYIGSNGGIIEVGCNAHARRRFFDARTSDAQRAHHALAWYSRLYAVEREAMDLGDDERRAVRQEKAVPILADMHDWLIEQQRDALPKSPIGEALGYTLNQWQALCRYTEAGFLTIDNNLSEREMKRLAIGRKNYLFVGSHNGGRTAAVIYSFTSTCQRHRIDPFAARRARPLADAAPRPTRRAAARPLGSALRRLRELIPHIRLPARLGTRADVVHRTDTILV